MVLTARIIHLFALGGQIGVFVQQTAPGLLGTANQSTALITKSLDAV